MAKKKDLGITPIFDRVLVIPVIPEKEKTSSGILIPETVSKEKPEEGIVAAIGNDIKCVKVGDKVLFSKYGYDEIKVDGEDYFILREENILAVIK